MNEAEILALLTQGLEGCEIEIQSEGNKLFLAVTGEKFAGMSRVARQQMIYAILNEQISSGEIHAVSMKCLTPAERQP